MTQNDPKTNVDAVTALSCSILRRIARYFASAACTFALSVPLVSQDAMAQGWQITTQYYPGGWVETYREFTPGNGGITVLKQPAPGNSCPVVAFEVMNPGPGEMRCVGYVAPSWLR